MPLFSACAAVPFEQRTTPAGAFCVDMPVYPGGQPVDRPYHRIGVVSSEATASTEAERLWSLRKAACLSGGDAVIEGTNEESRTGIGNSVVTRASGTAVVFTRAAGSRSTPLSVISNPVVTSPTSPTSTSSPMTISPPPPAFAPTTTTSSDNGGDPPLLQESPAETPRKR